MFDKFQTSFQTLNSEWSFNADAFDMKEGIDKTIKQLDMHKLRTHYTAAKLRYFSLSDLFRHKMIHV